MIPYPQGGHPFDHSQISVPAPMQGQMPSAPQTMEPAAAPGLHTSAPQPAGDGAPPLLSSHHTASTASASPAAHGAESGVNSANDVESAAEKSVPPPPMVPAETHRFVPAHRPVRAQVPVPTMPAQPMDPSQMMAVPIREHESIAHGTLGKAPLDSHYMHRGAMVGDPSTTAPVAPAPTGGVYVRGSGRGQHQLQGGMHRGDRGMQRSMGDSNRGTPRGTGGNSLDTGRGAPNRKGKKGNRSNNGRHSHHNDRHGDGRNNDGKMDATGSPSNRDDRRFVREEKPKPEPNLNSMHFPPLPMASDNLPPRNSQLAVGSKSAAVKKEPAAESGPGLKHSGSGSDMNEAVGGISASAANNIEAIEKGDTNDAGSLGAMTSSVTDAKESTGANEVREANGKATNSAGSSESGCDVTKDSKKMVVDKSGAERASGSASSNGSAMSYAAILRSRKSVPPRPPPQSQRSMNAGSGKPSDNHGSVDSINGGPTQGGKDRNSRRRKVNHPKNNSSSTDSIKDVEKNTSHPSHGDVTSSKNLDGEGRNGEVKDVNIKESDKKSKFSGDATRPHSVWANKPKSVFQAASAASSGRSTSGVDSRKAVSPPNSQESAIVQEKGLKDPNSHASFTNGEIDSQSSANDTSTNGADLPDITQLTLDKGKSSSQPGESSVNSSKKDIGNTNWNQTTAKGAWASGGPKSWPKNSGNGVLEKAATAFES